MGPAHGRRRRGQVTVPGHELGRGDDAPASVLMLTEPANAQRDALEFLGIPIPPALTYRECHPARKTPGQIRSHRWDWPSLRLSGRCGPKGASRPRSRARATVSARWWVPSLAPGPARTGLTRRRVRPRRARSRTVAAAPSSPRASRAIASCKKACTSRSGLCTGAEPSSTGASAAIAAARPGPADCRPDTAGRGPNPREPLDHTDGVGTGHPASLQACGASSRRNGLSRTMKGAT
jgi:hypothetical protein